MLEFNNDNHILYVLHHTVLKKRNNDIQLLYLHYLHVDLTLHPKILWLHFL